MQKCFEIVPHLRNGGAFFTFLPLDQKKEGGEKKNGGEEGREKEIEKSGGNGRSVYI